MFRRCRFPAATGGAGNENETTYSIYLFVSRHFQAKSSRERRVGFRREDQRRRRDHADMAGD